jgi:hypothetical protein
MEPPHQLAVGPHNCPLSFLKQHRVGGGTLQESFALEPEDFAGLPVVVRQFVDVWPASAEVRVGLGKVGEYASTEEHWAHSRMVRRVACISHRRRRLSLRPQSTNALPGLAEDDKCKANIVLVQYRRDDIYRRNERKAPLPQTPTTAAAAPAVH